MRVFKTTYSCRGLENYSEVVGDFVKRNGKGKAGEIIEIRGKKVTVVIESMKLTIAVEELVRSKV
ncbi:MULTISPECIES: MutS2/Smr-associated SH3 domain-containing protein [unclassified Myroides]|uniref:MutS2/Smr-associated SH3 domain-containing protein n=1 Tax=unclassified Myroides TaxID=2642485 RepID=UPI00336BC541